MSISSLTPGLVPSSTTTIDRDGLDQAKAMIETLSLDSLPSHTHKHLLPGTKSIRLLEIVPGRKDEPMRCTLSRHYLESNPSYIALSYTWNSSGRTRLIECDGMRLEIGENLYHFLDEFRRKHYLHQYDAPGSISSRIWIDAVCINQGDMQERNEQVLQMRDVYTKAESVIVWLGSKHSNDELAFLLTRHPDLLKVSKFRMALLSILNKPYFTRVWVIQEFVLAPSVMLWCGELHADVADFDKVWQQWQEEQSYSGWSTLTIDIPNTPAWPLFKYRKDYHKSRKASPEYRLRDLLLGFSSAESSEMYDKVYGFLGLASTKDGTSYPIRPDYSKSPVEVLADVLRNQCCQPSDNVAASSDHELLTFLLNMLCVSRIDFARYLILNTFWLEEPMFLLTVSDFMIASLNSTSTILEIGSFREIGEMTYDNAKAALSDSAAEAHGRLTSADIRVLSSALVDSDTALGLEFDCYGRGNDAIQETVHASTQLLMRGLSHDKSDATKPLQYLPSTPLGPGLRSADIRQLISSSLNSAVNKYRKLLTEHNPNRNSFLYKRYATFAGTNNVIGVICYDSVGGQGPKVSSEIFVFANHSGTNKALIATRSEVGYDIVGCAIIAGSKSEGHLGGVARSLHNIFRKEDSSSNTPWKVFRDFDTTVTKFCFHCNIADLFELIRCGILDPSQLDRMLIDSLRGKGDGDLHRCEIGLSHCLRLQFANSQKTPVAHGWPVASRS